MWASARGAARVRAPPTAVHDAAVGRLSRPIQGMPTGAVSGALVVLVEMRAAKCGRWCEVAAAALSLQMRCVL